MRSLPQLAPLLAPLLALALASGCTHTVRLESIPDGAEVVMDDVVVGSTPYTWEEPLGPEGSYEVELRHGDNRRTIEVAREVFSWSGILATGGAGLACCVAANIAAVPLTCITASWFPVVVFAPLALGGLGVLMVPAGGGLGYYLLGHHGPDLVRVNLSSRRLLTEPPGLASFKRTSSESSPEEDAEESGGSEGAVYGY